MSRLELGKRIRALRTAKGYTIESFAHALGVSWISVSRWERGKNWPDNLDEVALLLGTTVDELVDGLELVA